MERTYQYDGEAVHAVMSVISDQSTVFSGTYDENGNMTCRMENETWFIQGYNDENRIVSISKLDGPCGTGNILDTWAYQYDGDGQRVQEKYFVGATLTSTKAYFMGGLYEVAENVAIKYYAIAGQTIAMDDGTGLQYLLTDHLGSVVAVTDANGTLTSQQRYLPFGEVRELPSFAKIQETDFGYTGQRSLEGAGLMDYRARFYSPMLGRFLQPDTIIPSAASPQTWNRYAYVNNNPVRYTDPTGHMAVGDEETHYDFGCTDPLYCENGQSRSPGEIAILKSSVILIFLVRPGQKYPKDRGIGTFVSNSHTIMTAAHVPSGGNIPIYNMTVKDVYGNEIEFNPDDVNFDYDKSTDLLSITLPSDVPGVVPATSAEGYIFTAGDSMQVAYNPTGLSLDVTTTNVATIPYSPAFVLGKWSIYGAMQNPSYILGHGDSGGGVFFSGQFVGVVSNVPYSYALVALP